MMNATTAVDAATDRETRLRFMRIDPTTGSLLRRFWMHVEPRLPVILEGFYKHVTSEPNLARMMGNEIPRLKAAQGSHWRRLFDGRFDDAYMRGIRAIGVVHNRIGLEPRWYIGGYNYVLGELTQLAVHLNRFRPDHLVSLLKAIESAVMIDMDIAISVYQESMLAERQERQNKLVEAIDDFDGQMKAALETVSGSASTMQSNANALAASAEESSRQANAVAAASEQASANVQTVAAATEELSSSISEISRQVAESTRIASQAVDQANRTNGVVQSLAERAQKIGDVIKLITDIASQTNLLALNATIEAARAGDAGKGFAVVASEVKNLASQTAKSTEEISLQIAAIQGATQESVGAIQEIAGTIAAVSEIAAAIAAAVEQQGAATKEIARNVQEASTGTHEVSTNISGVSVAANETGQTAVEVLTAAQELSRQSETLRDQVEGFFAKIRA